MLSYWLTPRTWTGWLSGWRVSPTVVGVAEIAGSCRSREE